MYKRKVIKMKKNKISPTKSGFQDLKPTIWIGRSGISENIVNEIKNQVKLRKAIKVKWLQSAEVNPDEIAEITKTALLQVRGHTFILGDRSMYAKKA